MITVVHNGQPWPDGAVLFPPPSPWTLIDWLITGALILGIFGNAALAWLG